MSPPPQPSQPHGVCCCLRSSPSASLRRVRDNPFMKRSVWHALRDYNRPDFHPDDHDTDELLEHWRVELFGPQGTLNDKLAGAAAGVG